MPYCIMIRKIKNVNPRRRNITMTSDVPTKKNGKKKKLLVPTPLVLLMTKRMIPAIITRIPKDRKF
jgi:hypothetical protein